MALGNVPFYAGLMALPVNDKKPSQSHILIYGAIEVHHMGERGCIASNKTLGADVGVSPSRAASIVAEIAAAGWIEVIMGEKNERIGIEPLLTIAKNGNPPSQTRQAPHANSGNIDNNIENSEKADDVESLFFDLAEKLGMARRPVLTSTRRAKLKARLKNFTPIDLIEVALTISKDEFMQGKNDGGKKYGTIDYLIRNDEKIEYWINEAMSAKANGGDLSEQFAGKTGTRSAALDKLKDLS